MIDFVQLHRNVEAARVHATAVAATSAVTGSWVGSALRYTTRGRSVSTMLLSSWDRTWQCHTEVPPIVYRPTQTVMASLIPRRHRRSLIRRKWITRWFPPGLAPALTWTSS